MNIEQTLNEFNSIYEDLRILSEYKIELRTKLNNITLETSQEEKDMLNADITSLYQLIQEKIDLIKDLESTLLEYYEREGIEKDHRIEELIDSEKKIVDYIYTDNNGLERYFEATVLDRKEYEEINNRLKEIKKKSKKLQPTITGAQKSFKDQALRAEGFIETTDGILIHPSLIDEYERLLSLKFDLENKYKNSHTLKEKYEELLDNIKEIDPSLTKEQISEIINKKRNDLIKEVEEENKQAEIDSKSEEVENENIVHIDSIEDIENKINDLINKSQGRKQFVEFCGKQYYIAKKDVGKLLSLLSRLRRRKIDQIDDGYLSYIKSELNKRGFTDNQTNIITVDDLKNIIKNNPDEDLIKLLIDFINKNEAKFVNNNNPENVSMIPVSNNESVALVPYEKVVDNKAQENEGKPIYFAENDIYEPKTPEHELKEAKERLKPTTDDLELKRIIDGVTLEQVNLIKLLHPELGIDEIVMFLAKEEYKTNRISPLINASVNSEMDDDFEDFTSEFENKPKKFTIKSIKKFAKKHSKKIIAAILAALTIASSFTIISKFMKKKDKEDINETNVEEIIEDIDKPTNPQINKENEVDKKPQEIQRENVDDYDFTIGSIVTVSSLPDARIYKSTYDAKDNNNSLEPYFDYNDERVILGVTVRVNGIDSNIFAYNENFNKKIENMLALGGKIVNVCVGNKSKTEELKNYSGEQMTYSEYMRCVEGWYNIEDINIKESGHVK